MIFVIWLFLVFLCWGSFLNVVAYRLTYERPFFAPRSYCPSCLSTIVWYDNIPVFSWFLLRGKCRACRRPVSWLYPAIELASGLLLTSVYFLTPDLLTFFAYFIMFSALLVATRTDLQAMVIPQLVTIWLIPVGVIASLIGASNLIVIESVLGALLGYGVLWLVGYVFKRVTKRDGIGVGDMELLGMIGAFLGPIGVWFSLLIGSLVGLVLGGGYLFVGGRGRDARIPFGPFLALGATIFFFFQRPLIAFFCQI